MSSSTDRYHQQFLDLYSQTTAFPQLNILSPDTQSQQNSQNFSLKDSQQCISESPFRSSDPTILNRHQIVGFQKTGQLLRRIKRQLSSKNLQKGLDKSSWGFNDKLSTQHSNCDQKQLMPSKFQWQKYQKDQMTEAMIDEYQKQILRLRAELQDIKQEKKEIKQTLQKQRKFYMTQMYSKQLVNQQYEYQIQKLKETIQKHINLEYQFQQKIRLLEIENSQYKYQLDAEGLAEIYGNYNQQDMETIYEENEEMCGNSTVLRNRNSSKLFRSVDNGFYSNHNKQDPFELIRLAHEKQIVQYQKQLKNMKQFYQNRIKIIKKNHTPQKAKQRNSISIMDEYVCNDNISCQSQSYRNPQNLKFLLKDFQANSKSSKKVVDMDCESTFTIKHFAYPIQHSKKNLLQNIEEDMFINETISEQDYKELEMQIRDTSVEPQIVKETKFQKLKRHFPPFSKQFVKGIAVGSLAGGIIALLVSKKLNASI